MAVLGGFFFRQDQLFLGRPGEGRVGAALQLAFLYAHFFLDAL